MKTIDIEWLESKDACKEGTDYFKENFTEVDALVLINHLLKTNDRKKIKWANWLVTSLLDKTRCVRYAVYAAELVLPIFESKYPDDKTPRAAIEAAKTWLLDPSEENELAAGEAAWNAEENASWKLNEGAKEAVEVVCAAREAAIAAADNAADNAADYAAWGATNAAARAAAPAADEYTDGYKKTLIDIVNYGVWLL